MSAVKSVLGILVPLAIVLLICGMAMHVTGEDNACTDAGGRLEFSSAGWSGEVCIRDGKVVDP